MEKTKKKKKIITRKRQTGKNEVYLAGQLQHENKRIYFQRDRVESGDLGWWGQVDEICVF